MLRKWLKNTSGSIAIASAVILPVAVGFMGLGAEVSYWYFTQRKIQSAADAAAYAAAVQLRAGLGQSEMETEGTAVAEDSGYDISISTAVFNSPPVTGAFVGQQAVEVTLTENTPRYMTKVYTSDPLSFSGRAVALLSPPSTACVIALDTTAQGSITFTGTSDVLFEDCDVVTNSIHPDAIEVIGGGQVELDCLAAVGGVLQSGSSSMTLNECAIPVENSHSFQDPYYGTPEPDVTQPCEAVNTFDGPPSSIYNIGPGRYCGGMFMKRTVNLDPGIYVVDGGVLDIVSSAVVRGTGVMFFLTNDATLHIAAGADVQISGMTSGTYEGLVVYADADNDPALEYTINGQADSYVNGAIYAPSGTVVLEGGSSTAGGCTQIVARLVRFAGGSGVGSNCTGAGVNTAFGIERINLVE